MHLIKAINKDETLKKTQHGHHLSHQGDSLPDVLTLHSRKERTTSEDLMIKMK
jgi:hypothetical protein